MIKRLFRGNNLARILSVFLAIILWLFVSGDNLTRNTPIRKVIQGVPLQFENLDEGYTVTEIPATVDITLEGVSGAFDGLTIEELEAYIDLAEKPAGKHQVKVRGKPPRGLTLITFYPETVEVVIEELVNDYFEVEIKKEGKPARGWKVLLPWKCLPEQVVVEAPRSVFETIGQVIVKADLNGAQGVYRQELVPVVLDREGNELLGVGVSPGKVEVTIILVKEEPEDSNR